MGRGILNGNQRRRILARDGGACRGCGTSIPVVIKIHHVVPVELGGHDADDNLIAVCANCHDLIHHFGSKRRNSNARAELAKFGVPKPTVERIVYFAASIASARHEGDRTGRITLRSGNGEPANLPTLEEALARCIHKNKMSSEVGFDFNRAVFALVERIPPEVVPKCAFRLTHNDSTFGASLMNSLLLRAPARPDVGRKKSFGGVFAIAPNDSGLARKFDIAHAFKAFPAVNIWCEYGDVQTWHRNDWQDFTNGCVMAAAAPKSRSWLSNVRLEN